MLNVKALVSCGAAALLLCGTAIAGGSAKKSTASPAVSKAPAKRKAPAARKASAKRKAPAARKASAKRKAPAARKASAKRKAPAARKASAKRKAPTLKLNAKQQALLKKLHKALSNKDLGVRIEGVEALLKIKPAPSYLAGRLIGALTGDGDGNARSVIAENLLKIAPKSETAMDALANATIKDKDVNVRITAFKALQTCGKACKRTVPVLKKSVDNYDPLIREHAQKAINAILGIKPRKKAAPRKAAPKKTAVKKAAPRKAAKKTTPQAAPKKATPKASSSVNKSGK